MDEEFEFMVNSDEFDVGEADILAAAIPETTLHPNKKMKLTLGGDDILPPSLQFLAENKKKEDAKLEEDEAEDVRRYKIRSQTTARMTCPPAVISSMSLVESEADQETSIQSRDSNRPERIILSEEQKELAKQSLLRTIWRPRGSFCRIFSAAKRLNGQPFDCGSGYGSSCNADPELGIQKLSSEMETSSFKSSLSDWKVNSLGASPISVNPITNANEDDIFPTMESRFPKMKSGFTVIADEPGAQPKRQESFFSRISSKSKVPLLPKTGLFPATPVVNQRSVRISADEILGNSAFTPRQSAAKASLLVESAHLKDVSRVPQFQRPLPSYGDIFPPDLNVGSASSRAINRINGIAKDSRHIPFSTFSTPKSGVRLMERPSVWKRSNGMDGELTDSEDIFPSNAAHYAYRS